MTDKPQDTFNKIASGSPISDRELAAQYRDEMTRALQPVLEVLDRSRANGLIVGFNIKQDPIGRNIIDFIQVVRHY